MVSASTQQLVISGKVASFPRPSLTLSLTLQTYSINPNLNPILNPSPNP